MYIYIYIAIKVKFTLQQAMKAQRSRRCMSTLSLTSALDGGGWLTHVPVALTPGKIPGTHCIGGWVGPKAGLDGC